jgi:hypothetical protein
VARHFLLSPANCGGRRAQQLLSDRAASPLAHRLRSAEGAPLGDVFAFMSGLYFRGKLAYARRFAQGDGGDGLDDPAGVLIITPGIGLEPPDTLVTRARVLQFADTSVDAANDAFTRPLVQAACRLRDAIAEHADVILLGSIASPKYVSPLLEVFGGRLLFPREFVGRGDMSRGGLLLRQADAGDELQYVPVGGTIRRGVRPAKLPPLPRRSDGAGSPNGEQ